MKTVIEYETELKELAKFIPKLANFEKYFVSSLKKDYHWRSEKSYRFQVVRSTKKWCNLPWELKSLPVKEGLEIVSKRERDLVSCLVSNQKRVVVLNLLKILLDLGLILLVLHSLSNHHNLPSWVRHHRVLLLRVGQCQRGAPVVNSFIQGLVVRHKCAFSVDKSTMSIGYVWC